MLKTLFWLLLLINGGLFALHRGYLGGLIADGREPQRMANQLQADKVRLLPASALAAPVAAPAPTPPAEPAPAVAANTGPIACTEIGNFEPAEAKRLDRKSVV